LHSGVSGVAGADVVTVRTEIWPVPVPGVDPWHAVSAMAATKTAATLTSE
jgi:hypothetical protein